MSAGWHIGNDAAAGHLSHFSSQGKEQVRRTHDKGAKEKISLIWLWICLSLMSYDVGFGWVNFLWAW